MNPLISAILSEANCMTGKYFVDTNVLVYARDASESTKQPQAQAWLAWFMATP
ncbi:MAG: hypothetical protein U5K56_13065 [Halioglobus sp.]|nr:hypothetical protein [Halioglobus sp.]